MAAFETVKDVLLLEVLATRGCQGQCREDQSFLQDLAGCLGYPQSDNMHRMASLF